MPSTPQGPRPRSMAPVAPPGGPYLQVAVLCEKALQEQDGVLSLIRIVDRITTTAIGPDAPAEMPPVPVNLTAVIVLKAGQARGRYGLRIGLEAPSGLDAGPDVHLPVFLEGEDRGVNLVVAVNLQAEQEGLYWFNVFFGDDEVLLTRIPLRIVYQPQRTGSGPAAPSSADE